MQEYRGCKYLDFKDIKNGCPMKSSDINSNPRFLNITVYPFIDGKESFPINTDISVNADITEEEYHNICKKTIDNFLKDYEESQK